MSHSLINDGAKNWFIAQAFTADSYSTLTLSLKAEITVTFENPSNWPGAVAHACNPSTLEAEAGGSPEVRHLRPA